MRPVLPALVALTFVAACERPDLGDDTSDSSDTSDTGTDTNDTNDTGDTDTSDTDTGFDTNISDTQDTSVADTSDTGLDTATDTGFGWDPLYLYPASTSCHDTLANQRGVQPTADGTWAAGRFPADSVNPMTVYQVRVVMRHGTDSAGVHCDASGPFEMRLFVTDTAAAPNGNTNPVAARTKTFGTATMGSGDTHRDLVYELETPLLVPNTDNLWVAVDGNVPQTGDPSCWQVCKTGNLVDSQNQNFYTTQADQASWVWTPLYQKSGGIDDYDYMEFMMTVWYLE